MERFLPMCRQYLYKVCRTCLSWRTSSLTPYGSGVLVSILPRQPPHSSSRTSWGAPWVMVHSSTVKSLPAIALHPSAPCSFQSRLTPYQWDSPSSNRQGLIWAEFLKTKKASQQLVYLSFNSIIWEYVIDRNRPNKRYILILFSDFCLDRGD